MGIAHLGIGLAAKPAANKVPLWVLLVASELLDLLSFVFFLFGLESPGESQASLQNGLEYITPGNIPWSHGLLMSILWSSVAAGIGILVFRDRRAGMVIGLVVFSHWVLDYIVHAPDLPLLFQGSPLLGMGLWTSGPGFIISIILEIVLLGGGLAIYLMSRKQRPITGYAR